MNLNKIPPQIPVFGDITYRGECPLEVSEQIGFLCLLKTEFPELAKIAVHIRNEGKRTKLQGFRQKIEGMNTGASDIIIPCNPPILIELKRRDHTQSSISPKQLSYLVDSQKQGAFACFALGGTGAIEAVRAWNNYKKIDDSERLLPEIIGSPTIENKSSKSIIFRIFDKSSKDETVLSRGILYVGSSDNISHEVFRLCRESCIVIDNSYDIFFSREFNFETLPSFFLIYLNDKEKEIRITCGY